VSTWLRIEMQHLTPFTYPLLLLLNLRAWTSDTPKVPAGPLVNEHVFKISVPKWIETKISFV
jgi:hypothetical protein